MKKHATTYKLTLYKYFYDIFSFEYVGFLVFIQTMIV